MNRIKCIIKEKKGSSFPLAVAVALALVFIMCGIYEYMRLMIIASSVRDAVQSAIIATVNDNYDEVYSGVREGYSGGYALSGAVWEDRLDYGDIYSRLDRVLGLRESGGVHIKYAGEKVEFKLSNLSVNIVNATFAPSDPHGMQKFLADAAILLEVPVAFGGKTLLPMRINLKVKAGYIPKF
jgi:hypothetical protein